MNIFSRMTAALAAAAISTLALLGCDEQKIKDLAGDAQPQKAVQVAEAAKLYGDNQVRKDANQYIEYIRAQAAVSGAVTEEPETEEKPEEGGVPEDLEAELKELENDDDLR